MGSVLSDSLICCLDSFMLLAFGVIDGPEFNENKCGNQKKLDITY